MVVHRETAGPAVGPLFPEAWEPRDPERRERRGRPERILRGTIEERPLGARGGTDRGGRARPAGMAADAGPGVAIPVELRREQRMVCVEYPGVVRDVSKMLSTLGGEEGVSRVRKGESPGPRGRDGAVGAWPEGRGQPGEECGFLGNGALGRR